MEYENIAPGELKHRLESGARPEVLDVREPWEFALSRLEGARLIPLAQLPERAAELDPTRETVVVCHHGLRSAHAARMLSRAGFGRVLNLTGGLEAYSLIDGSVPRY